MHELCNLVKEKACFKNMQSPSCIDLLLTNDIYAFTLFCHKFFLTILKTTIPRSQRKETTYRDYKQFDTSKFKKELKSAFTKENIDSCTKFDGQLLKVFNSHKPLKKKLSRANHAPYISKTLRKSIMKRSYLEKIYFKKPTDHFLKAYKKQKTNSSHLYKKEGKNSFRSLNPPFVKHDKLFWKKMKPLFSNKGNLGPNITLVEEKKTSCCKMIKKLLMN